MPIFFPLQFNYGSQIFFVPDVDYALVGTIIVQDADGGCVGGACKETEGK